MNGKIVAIPPVLNKKIREMNLYGIYEILRAENPRVFTLLSAVVERDVIHENFWDHSIQILYRVIMFRVCTQNCER
jgi:hypothetical protein